MFPQSVYSVVGPVVPPALAGPAVNAESRAMGDHLIMSLRTAMPRIQERKAGAGAPPPYCYLWRENVSPLIASSGVGMAFRTVDSAKTNACDGHRPTGYGHLGQRRIQYWVVRQRGMTRHHTGDLQKAEGVGFEPTVGLPPQRFSRPSQSSTLAPLRVKDAAVG